MAKRLMVLLGMLAMTLSAAVPALAQEAPRYGEAQYAEVPATVTATGVLGRAAPHSPDPAPVYAITDEATGTPYELISGFVELEPFVGQRVTIEGGEVPGNPPPGAPLFLNVTSIAPADDPGEGSDVGVLGTITDISGSVVLVEEDPSDWGDPTAGPEGSPSSPKGFFTVTDETEITKQEDGASVPAAFEDLEVGQTVEAAYAGGFATSYPTQGNAASIAILEELTCMLPEGCEPGPSPGRSATLSFELAVECEPPADATFFGNVQTGEGGPGIFAELADPDGDGLYAGIATLPDRFAPGPAPEGTEPVSLRVQVVQGTGTRTAGAGTLPGEPTSVVRDFGVVPMEAENTFSADASFCDGGGTDDGNGNGDDGGDNGGNEVPVVSGDTANANNGSGSVAASGGGAAKDATPSVAQEGVASPIANVLPATGGVLPLAGLVGLVIVAAGLLVRRISR